MVVMEKEDYIRKAEKLLDQPAYKSIPTDPTTKYKNKLVSLLKTIRTGGGINEVTYTGHKISIDNFSTVGRDDQNLMRTIKEAPYIRVNNRNIGK